MQIFISYSPEDKETALRLYHDLKQHNLKPWLDQEDLLPGQNWKSGIRQAIKESAYFLTLISARSVSEKGFVQKEQRIALEVLDELPPDKIFIIPVSVDGSKPAFERMTELHPVNLFPSYEKGLEKILKFVCKAKSGHAESPKGKNSDSMKKDAAKSVSESSNMVNIGKDAAKNVIVSGNGNIIHVSPYDNDTSVQMHNPAKSEQADKAENNSPKFQTLSPMRYAWISLAAFVPGLILLSVFVNKAADPNVSHRVFYVLLIPAGLCTAAFLFGAMRSYAVYSGKVLNGMLEIGGPAVIAILTVIGGFLLVPDTKPFDMTVFVHGSKGQQDAVIRNKGMVTMDLDGNRRSESIGEKGQAYFSGIPAGFINQEVLISVEAEGFETAKPGKTVLKPGSIYVEVKPDGRLGKISGTVRDGNEKPLPGVTLSIGKVQTVSDASGWFEMEIPVEMQKEKHSLSAFLKGFRLWKATVYPATGQPVEIVLEKE